MMQRETDRQAETGSQRSATKENKTMSVSLSSLLSVCLWTSRSALLFDLRFFLPHLSLLSFLPYFLRAFLSFHSLFLSFLFLSFLPSFLPSVLLASVALRFWVLIRASCASFFVACPSSYICFWQFTTEPLVEILMCDRQHISK